MLGQDMLAICSSITNLRFVVIRSWV